jgi:hypothetical protein
MEGAYLTTLPRQFMRGVAGFDPDYPTGYYLPRDALVPPESLQKKVWPQADQWAVVYDRHHSGESGEEVDDSIALGAFLDLLTRLRTVFLQVC